MIRIWVWNQCKKKCVPYSCHWDFQKAWTSNWMQRKTIIDKYAQSESLLFASCNLGFWNPDFRRNKMDLGKLDSMMAVFVFRKRFSICLFLNSILWTYQWLNWYQYINQEHIPSKPQEECVFLIFRAWKCSRSAIHVESKLGHWVLENFGALTQCLQQLAENALIRSLQLATHRPICVFLKLRTRHLLSPIIELKQNAAHTFCKITDKESKAQHPSADWLSLPTWLYREAGW